jgi:hypothetical protein
LNRRDFLVGLGAAAVIAPIAPIAPIASENITGWMEFDERLATGLLIEEQRTNLVFPSTRMITAFIDDYGEKHPLSPDLLPIEVGLVADDDDPFEDEEPT